MSTDTHNPNNQGQQRRRRRNNNGGQNRNYNNSNRRNNGRSNDRDSDSGQRSDNRSGGRSNQGSPSRRPMPAPKLSWFQKILKAIGLYKEPVRPPRPERRPDAPKTEKSHDPRRTKTRDARSENREPSDSNQRDKRRDRNENDGRPRGGDASSVESRRVYVGNLSFEATESDLEELFKGVGAVRRVEIIYNRSTHRSKGYGFIEMLDIDEAKRCVEVLHDQFFMGRKLTVSGAKSKDYENAEGEEPAPTTMAMPELAPINPIKEEVTSLIDEPANIEPEITQPEAVAETPEPTEATEEIKA